MHNTKIILDISFSVFFLELIVQEGLDLVGAELYCELEDEEKENGLQRPVEGDEALLKAIEPSFAEAMHKHGEHEDGYPERALGYEGWDALGVELGEHPVQKVLGGCEVGTTEEDPREHDEHLAQEPTGNLHPQTVRGQTMEEEPVAPLVHHKTEAVHGSPEDEHEGASVPQTCHHHGDEVVEIGAHLSHLVASQRDVEIVAEPGGERNVPPSPKL